jgi:threonine synthase
MINDTYRDSLFGNVTDGDDPKDIVPIRRLSERLYLMRLANGPTGAFKDLALQFLGRMFEYLLKEHRKVLNVLGATSGDTGSAAIRAMMNRVGINTFMLSPAQGMTPVQQAQMWGVNDPSVHNLTVSDFDTGQRLVKAVSGDLAFKEQYSIGAINSINWVRVAAQVVYYVWAGLKVNGRFEPFDVSVPTGNFGDICAAHIAKHMGVPIRKLILATNENAVLDHFFKTGVYKPADEVVHTISPSMDITEASNFERYVYLLYDGDTEKVCALWDTLAKTGSFDISGDMDQIRKTGFVSESVPEYFCKREIQQTYSDYGIIIDPHTATAMCAARWLSLKDDVPCVVAETAQPFKFDDVIMRVLQTSAPRPAAFEGIENMILHHTSIEPTKEAVQDYIRKHV